MKHLVDNISTRNLGCLEQACERYAMMAYEVLRRELAIGFRSTTYSYRGDQDDQRAGVFRAVLVPWKQTDKYRHGHRSTEITFNVRATPDGNGWELSRGCVKDVETGLTATIRFDYGGRRIALNIPLWDEIRFGDNATHSSEAVTPLNREPWANLYESRII